MTKSNGGTLTLSGANTYSGGTTINEGTTLVVGNGTALGSGALTLNGGTTGVTVNFNGSFSVGNNIVATGDPTYNVLTGNTVNLTGVLSGSGDVVVNEANGYAGTLILSGANTDHCGRGHAAGRIDQRFRQQFRGHGRRRRRARSRRLLECDRLARRCRHGQQQRRRRHADHRRRQHVQDLFGDDPRRRGIARADQDRRPSRRCRARASSSTALRRLATPRSPRLPWR
ncbi:autotransporter-associated beta strand repeat-containing protein [Bradyrhizobium diazoefficiens]|uniref:autotransporter-associated beta strand repeat-containing protein n=1 Tax=Bradyrhizobium diazoefficiens TaxID=1355477 RepID=UPI00384F3FC6